MEKGHHSLHRHSFEPNYQKYMKLCEFDEIRHTLVPLVKLGHLDLFGIIKELLWLSHIHHVIPNQEQFKFYNLFIQLFNYRPVYKNTADKLNTICTYGEGCSENCCLILGSHVRHLQLATATNMLQAMFSWILV